MGFMLQFKSKQLLDKNSGKEHTIHAFHPTVDQGCEIVETPNNVVYLPVNR